MDIALIIGVVLGLVFMIGSMQIAFMNGAAGSFANFVDAPSFGIVIGGMLASIFVALESFMKFTPFTFPMNSNLCDGFIKFSKAASNSLVELKSLNDKFVKFSK